MVPKFETREELLQDAINYFWGNPERKCIDHNGNCVYHPSISSEGCAVGRLIPLELAKELTLGVSDNRTFEALPPWLRSMGQDFLLELQNCHDYDVFSTMDEDGVYDRMKDFVIVSDIIFPTN